MKAQSCRIFQIISNDFDGFRLWIEECFSVIALSNTQFSCQHRSTPALYLCLWFSSQLWPKYSLFSFQSISIRDSSGFACGPQLSRFPILKVPLFPKQCVFFVLISARWSISKKKLISWNIKAISFVSKICCWASKGIESISILHCNSIGFTVDLWKKCKYHSEQRKVRLSWICLRVLI